MSVNCYLLLATCYLTMESTATIRLRAVDTGVVTTINNVSTASTNALLGATALAGGFKLLEKASTTSVAQMAIGAEKAQLLTDNFGKLSVASNSVTQSLGKLSSAAFVIQQVAIAADGVGRAAERYARLPQAMQAMQASGVSTYSIQQFNQLTEAIRGSDLALDSLLVSSIAELGEFEKAAARAGTILKSSLRFDESGNPLTANAEERLANAIAAQRLVNSSSINNAVSSSEALRGQYEVLSSGFTNQKESQEVLEQGLKLIGIGRAGGANVNTTATLQLLTKTLNAYELSAADAAKTAAILNATVENGLTTIQELSNGFGATSAQASKANIALVDTAAAVSVLTAQGTSTAESLTGIARVSANIINKTPEAEKELAKLQLRGEKIRFDKAEIQAKGFTQALIDLYDAAGGSSEILTKIFPEDVAFRTVNALLTEQGRRLSQTKQAISGADETKLNEIFEVAQSDRTARFLRLANRFKESIIEIGISLAPTLEPGIQALETIANKFAGLPEPVRKAIGSYLAFRIQSKAVGGAAGELIKTLVSLGTNYLLVRTLSLALTGQLGKEVSAIKSLITQKKGLAAATLQLFGIDQKWRLEQETATNTIAKQSKVARAAATAKAKASEVTKNVATAAIARTSGITKEQVKQELERRKQQAQSFAQIVAPWGTTGAQRARALAQTGKQKAQETAQQLADRYGFQLPTVIAAPKPAQKPVALLPPADVPAAGAVKPPQPIGGFGFSGLKSPPQPIGGFGFSQLKSIEREKLLLNQLTSKNAAVVATSNKFAQVQADYDKAQAIRTQAINRRQKAIANVGKAEIELEQAKGKAIAATTDRTTALNNVKQKQQKLTAAQNTLAQRQLEFTNANTASLVRQNQVIAAQAQLEQARTAAKAKYAPLAKAIAIQERIETKAIALNEAAKVARIKAEQAEIALGNKSKITMLFKRDAYLAETLATKATTAATQAKNAVTSLETKLTYKQRLAEQGLYEARIFGNKVLLAETGLIGGLNKVLTTQISLKKAAIVTALPVLVPAKLLQVATNLQNIQIGIESVKLAGVKTIRVLESGGLIALKGVKSVSGAIAGLLSPLGALSPLLLAGGVAAIALRSELFGLGADVRKLSKDYQQFLKDQEKLNVSLERRAGITRIETILFGKEEAVTINQTQSAIGKQLIALKDSGAITTTQFNRLATAFDKTVISGDKAKENLAEFRAELKRVKADAEELEQGVYAKVFGGIKKLPGLAGGAFDTSLNWLASVIPSIAKGRNVTANEVAIAREANSLITPLDNLYKLQIQSDERFSNTRYAIDDYRESLALTSEVQAKVALGVKLTTADLANEEVKYKTITDRNRSVIEKLEKDIATTKDLVDKVKDEENKKLLENQIQLSIQRKEALEAENEALKQLQEDTKKYLTETLPAIQTALKESGNPAKALIDAQEKFDQKFIVDAEGQATKLLKPIEILRDEGGKLASQIQENLALGLFDNVGGEAYAADLYRKIRDDQFSVLENGKNVTGYTYLIGQRRELTAQIIQLENADLKRAIANNQIKIDLAKTLQQAQLTIAEDTNLKIAKIEKITIDERIKQKKSDIAELKELGLRTIDEEIQLEKLKVQKKQSFYRLQSAELQQQFERDRFANQQQELISQQLILSSQQRVAIAREENALSNLSLGQIEKRLQVEERLASLSSTISQNQIFNAQTQLDLAISRQATLQTTLPLQRQQLKNQIANTKEQKEQRLIEAENRVEKAELAEIEAERSFNLANSNDASKEQLERLKLQVEQSYLNTDNAREAVTQAKFQVELNEELSTQKLDQFETSKQLEQSSSAIAVSQATLAATEAKITRELKAQTIALGEKKSELIAIKSETVSETDFKSGQLSLAAKLTDSEQKKQKIAQQIATLKLNSLTEQIEGEAEILAIKQKQQELELDSKINQNKGSLEQNKVDILKAQAEQDRLIATGANEEEIKASQSLIDAQFAQRQVILTENRRLSAEKDILAENQRIEREAFERSSKLTIDKARADAVQALPEKQQENARKRLAKEFLRTADVSSSPNLLSAINTSGKFIIEVPQIKIPEIRLPSSLDSIAADFRSLVSEFNVSRRSLNTSNTLGAFEGEGKKFVIQNLSMDSPINITIQGEDKEDIAEQVEGVVNNKLVDIFSEMENQLNGF